KLTGTDVAQTAAMVATLREATQRSAKEIGTALRSIFIQMRRPQAILALRGFAGVETYETEGGIRPTIDILAQLAAKWDTLSEVQRHNLAIANAQIFRYNEFVVLLEKFGRVLELTNIAYRSQGYTQQEISLFTQSLQARLAALSAEFQNLAFSLADSTTRGLTLSNVAKFIIEGLTNILAGFRAATGASGSFASSLQTLLLLLPVVVVGLARLKASLDAIAVSVAIAPQWD
ncbi:MAG: phage tail tape measure protein, partial [Armatimonadota bacterium]|nr:phage tail tape measure protein [Armatimonadota bacterium]MDW8144577.1 phage tail tape measure protein [Armatimonadota bacterium]